ncbi:MAG: lysophospholipid acyltransferase family protein [bacterium]
MDILFWAGWTFFRVLSRLLLRARVSGTEHVPRQGPFIVACNHISYYDPPIVGCWVPRGVYFLAKAELFRWGPIGWLLRKVHARPVRRGVIDRGALEMADQILEDGLGLVVFPEGTRARKGEFLPPKPGLGRIALKAGCPIVPAYIRGSDRIGACLTFREHLRIEFGEPITSEWLASLEIGKDSYLSVSQAVMDRIRQLRERDERIKDFNNPPDNQSQTEN